MTPAGPFSATLASATNISTSGTPGPWPGPSVGRSTRGTSPRFLTRTPTTSSHPSQLAGSGSEATTQTRRGPGRGLMGLLGTSRTGPRVNPETITASLIKITSTSTINPLGCGTTRALSLEQDSFASKKLLIQQVRLCVCNFQNSIHTFDHCHMNINLISQLP